MNEFIYKQDYIERANVQIEVYKEFLTAIDMILSELPETGGRFSERFFGKLNKDLKDKDLHIIVRPCALCSDIGVTLYTNNYPKTWQTYLSITQDWESLAQYGQMYEKGIMKNKDVFLAVLSRANLQIKSQLDKLNKAVGNIDTFIEKWEKFYEAYKEMRAVGIPHITLPDISSVCPIYPDKTDKE